MTRTPTLFLAAAALALACGGRSDDPDTRSGRPGTGDAADSARVGAARAMVAFLRGEAPLDPALLADSVALRVAPEGGGESRRVPRAALEDRGAWRVGRFDLVPPPSLTRLTTAAGSHLSCIEAPLATRAPDLAARPHVGAILRPPVAESCLQAWTLTFVFADSARPVITDVLYDQWEW